MNTIDKSTPSMGDRYNAGKTPLHLISWATITELAKVLEFGAKKYAARNWEKGLSFSDTFASLQRHAIAWYNGEDTDPETGLSHVAHMMCNSMFLLHFILTGTGKDDRPCKLSLDTDKEQYDATRIDSKPKPGAIVEVRDILPAGEPITRVLGRTDEPTIYNGPTGRRRWRDRQR